MVKASAAPSKLPLAPLALAAAMAVRSVSKAMPKLASSWVLAWMRTAGRAPPDSDTWPTPETWAILAASWLSTMFCTCVSGRVRLVMASVSTGASAGLTLA